MPRLPDSSPCNEARRNLNFGMFGVAAAKKKIADARILAVHLLVKNAEARGFVVFLHPARDDGLIAIFGMLVCFMPRIGLGAVPAGAFGILIIWHHPKYLVLELRAVSKLAT